MPSRVIAPCCYWIGGLGKREARPCVILQVFKDEGGDWMLTATGSTQTRRDLGDWVSYQPNSSAGRGMGLRTETHFYQGHITSEVSPGRCERLERRFVSRRVQGELLDLLHDALASGAHAEEPRLEALASVVHPPEPPDSAVVEPVAMLAPEAED